jgi:serine/threonine protein phosphatase PrpC
MGSSGWVSLYKKLILVKQYSHGPAGALMSQLVVDALKHDSINFSHLLHPDTLEEQMQKTINTSNQTLLSYGEKHSTESGTTLVWSVLSGQTDPPTLSVGWVGDSGAVMLKSPRKNTETNEKLQGSDLHSSEWQIQHLTKEHTLTRVDEVERIQKESKGVVVERSKNNWRVIPTFADYPEAAIKKDKLALNMSRSLGHHILSQYGVSPKPDFMRTTVVAGDLLLLASDGLFELFEDSDLLQIFLQINSSLPEPNLRLLAENLLVAAQSKAKKEKHNMDNCTIVLVRFC